MQSRMELGAVALLLALVAAVLGGSKVRRQPPPVPVQTLSGEKAFLRDTCPIAELLAADRDGKRSDLEPATARPESALATSIAVQAFAPVLLKQSLDAFSAHLAQEGQRRSGTTHWQTVTELYAEHRESTQVTVRRNVHCLILVRAQFGARQASGTSAGRQPRAQRWSPRALAEFGMAQAPAFYLELEARYLSNGTAVAFQPRYLDYAETAAESAGSGSKALLLTVLLARGGKVFATMPLRFPGKLEIGAQVGPALLSGLTTAHAQLPPPLELKDQLVEGRTALDLRTVTLQATLIESDSASAAHALLARLVGSAAEPIASVAGQITQQVGLRPPAGAEENAEQ